MRPDKLLIGIGVFTVFMILGFNIIFSQPPVNDDGLRIGDGGLLHTYKKNITAQNQRIFGKDNITLELDHLYNLSDNSRGSILNTESTQGVGGWEQLTNAGFSVMRLFSGSFQLVSQTLNFVALTLHIPAIVTSFIMLVMSIMVVFMIVFVIMRFMPRD